MAGVLSAALLAAVSAAAGVCHIHPPAATDQRPELIGPYADAHTCEHERRLRFGPAGRCHCNAAFTPGWLDPGVGARRGSAADDRRVPGAGDGRALPLP